MISIAHNPPTAAIEFILMDPAVHSAVVDDHTAHVPLSVSYCAHTHFWVATEGRRPAALMSGQLLSASLMVIHGLVLPGYRKGGRGVQIGRAMIERAAEDLPAISHISTITPAYHRQALHFMARCGMQREGLIPRAHLRHGTLWDLVVSGKEVN